MAAETGLEPRLVREFIGGVIDSGRKVEATFWKWAAACLRPPFPFSTMFAER